MLTWNVWGGTGDAWDALLMDLPDYCIYQCFGWGEFKRVSGWETLRLSANIHGQTVAMAQVLVRRFPLGVALAWVPGGPVGSAEVWNASFAHALRTALGTRHLYCRINSMSSQVGLTVQRLLSAGWCRPTSPLLSGKSVTIDLALPENEWLASIDSKHRYYVKKSSTTSIRWVNDGSKQSYEDFALLTRQLREDKSAALRETDIGMLDGMRRFLPGSVLLLVGYIDDQPITGCLTLIFSRKAHYAIASTVGEGRRVSAAYSMISELRGLLRERGVTHLDFGGVNPDAIGARGVNHFKKGFASEEISYLAEWEWATTSLLRKAASYLIKRRASAMS